MRPWRTVNTNRFATNTAIDGLVAAAVEYILDGNLILNYFKARKVISSGTIEGLNNKAKVTMRKSYGFRTFRVTELALYHSLGKLPEPETAHKFTDEAFYLHTMPMTREAC